MSLTLALLRTDLRTHLGMDTTDLPDADADRLLNRSWWALSSQLRFSAKDAEVYFDTTAGTRTYAYVTNFDAIQKVVIQYTNETDYTPLIRIDDWNMYDRRNDDEQGFPTHYSWNNASLVLWPNPDAAYLVRVKYLKTLQDIQASGPETPQEWHEVVLWGAVSRGFFNLGDWTRGQQAQAQQAIYLQSLDLPEERALEDRKYSGMRVMRRQYP